MLPVLCALIGLGLTSFEALTQQFVRPCQPHAEAAPNIALTALADEPNTLFLSFGERGIYSSVDSGHLWRRHTPAHMCIHAAAAFWEAPRRAGQICVRLGPLLTDLQHHCSDDGGDTFGKVHRLLPAQHRTQQIMHNPANRCEAVALSTVAGGARSFILKSVDGGKHFAIVRALEDTYLDLLGFEPGGSLLVQRSHFTVPFGPIFRLAANLRELTPLHGPWKQDAAAMLLGSLDSGQRRHFAVLGHVKGTKTRLYETYNGGGSYHVHQFVGLALAKANLDSPDGSVVIAAFSPKLGQPVVWRRRGARGPWRQYTQPPGEGGSAVQLMQGAQQVFAATRTRLYRLNETPGVTPLWMDVTPKPLQAKDG